MRYGARIESRQGEGLFYKQANMLRRETAHFMRCSRFYVRIFYVRYVHIHVRHGHTHIHTYARAKRAYAVVNVTRECSGVS